MSSARPAPLSSINTLKREWSSPGDAPTKPARPPQPILSEAELKASRAKRLERIQAAMSGSSGASGSIKRSSGSDSLEPPAKRRPTGTGEGDFVSTAGASDKKPATISVMAQITLSAEQQEILRLVTEGKNIFFTGSAGTGKSVLLREIIRALKKKYTRSVDAVAVTASTGIAACNIGGVTLHSFGGIGIGEGTAEQLANKIRKNKKAAGRWMRTQVLIIDESREVSMVDGALFDKLARIACLLKKTTKPFGGIQLVVCGDFFQLPPVTRGGEPTFAFEAQMWSDCVERTFNLTRVFRQKDQRFVDMLNEMRFGRLSPQSIARFKALSRTITYSDGLEPTELFPRREDVERANQSRMHSLTGDPQTYFANDGGTIADADQRAKLLSNMMAPTQLQLKINSQVMLIKNTDDTLVNGSMGHVIGFFDPGTYAKNITGVAEEQDKKGKKRDSAPLGMQVYPLVKFPIPGTNTFREVLVQPEVWKVELPSGEVQASRTQLPLILAWAMSIHKSQGQTLERVRVDLGRVFEKGQAYVALSRATSLEGLQVLNFDAGKVQAHPKVGKWSETLEIIN